MPFEVGMQIGVYSVIAKIGEGGMGEVYQARDTKLDRDVALKVLPEAFTSDSDRLARFEREAKVLASLNHPNIGSIYGLEEAEGVRALVLELVEGPTLADRIKQGPIPIDEALPIAKQIAEALEAAHEQGVIHRDLKPANIKVKDDGTVKVLDFGLAKAFQPDASDPNLSMSPTISLTAAATQMGMIIGTAAYMAPEQAKGRPVDKRADVWAFGAVVYEMLTGSRAFVGDDVSDTLAAVLRAEVNLDELAKETPVRLRQVLRACLQRDPRQRVQAIGDVRLAMDGVFETTVSVPADPMVAAPQLRLWQRPVVAVAALMGAILATGVGVWFVTRPEVVPPDLMRFVIVPPEDAPLGSSRLKDLAISPDGTQVVYNGGAPGGANPQLNLRPIDQEEGAPVRGSVGGFAPFFSADGEWVGFVYAGSVTMLQKISVFGGPPVLLTEAPNPIRGASWGTDDRIIFGTRGGGLFRVSGGGGEAEALTTLDSEQGETAHFWPSIMPEANAVLFVISAGNVLTDGQLAVLTLASGEVTRLGLAGFSPHYVATGHVVYAVEDGSVRAVPFDARSLTVTGNPVPLVEGVAVKLSGAANFSVSDKGRLVYVLGAGENDAEQSLVWVDRDGQEEVLVVPEADYDEPRVSPDGTRVAASIPGVDTAAIWIADATRGTLSRVTSDAANAFSPIWTSDGQHVVFASDRDGGRAFYRKSADGTGEVERLASIEDAGFLRTGNWSPDGNSLVFEVIRPDTGGDIGVLSMLEEPSWEPLLQTDANEYAPAVSPDGQWFAYVSNDTGRYEVYVQRFPDLGARQQISTNGGIDPLWSPDGRALYYLGTGGNAPDDMRVVSIDPGPPLSVGTPDLVFEGRYIRPRGSGRYHDIAPDGQRFLMVLDSRTELVAGTLTPEIHVVLNWFEELKERVPVP